ncbi:expressed unknown protein [Seminavis robusta]|uniref:G-protein coupled receptors family 1 profile domain-containing protein n=1 Tax=Seminavis robusta TaxID=568900 RepID=A0A9N8E3H7_9STRA|nr:expressed unknown protein [Seminavis robusta]|eukprot:Sro621_g176860.1 n/a (640) ;mRNA; r:47750-49753
MTGSGLTVAQERALALVPKFTSSLSIPCAMFLIYEVYCDHKRGGTNCIQRVLVGMSIIDILASSAWFLSTWAVPKGSFAFSAGNMATCNFQGFLLQLAIGAPLYNSSLAIFYLLMVKRRWTEDQLQHLERWVHGFILSFTIGTSVLLLLLGQYNHIQAVCWVIGDPPDCGNSGFQASDIPCERGDHAWAWGLALFYGPLWVCVVACCSSMVALCQEVKTTIRRSSRYTTSLGAAHSLHRSTRDSSKVATQAILYSLTFLITWMPSTLWSIAHWFNWSHYGLDIAAATAEPLQGMWNLMIFLRTRPSSQRKIQRMLAYLFPRCCEAPEEEVTEPSEPGSRLSLTQSVMNIGRVFGPLRLLSTRVSKLDLRDIPELQVVEAEDPCEVSRLGFSTVSSEIGDITTGRDGSSKHNDNNQMRVESEAPLDIDISWSDSGEADETSNQKEAAIDEDSSGCELRRMAVGAADTHPNDESECDIRQALIEQQRTNPQNEQNESEQIQQQAPGTTAPVDDDAPLGNHVNSRSGENDMIPRIDQDDELGQPAGPKPLHHQLDGQDEREGNIEMATLSSHAPQQDNLQELERVKPAPESATEIEPGTRPESPTKRKVAFRDLQIDLPTLEGVHPVDCNRAEFRIAHSRGI